MYNWKSFVLALITMLLLFAVAFFNAPAHSAELSMSVSSKHEVQSKRKCFRFEQMREGMAEVHGEHIRNIGVQANGELVVVFVNLDTGSFTIFIVSPDGVACPVSAGKGWQTINPPGAPA